MIPKRASFFLGSVLLTSTAYAEKPFYVQPLHQSPFCRTWKCEIVSERFGVVPYQKEKSRIYKVRLQKQPNVYIEYSTDLKIGERQDARIIVTTPNLAFLKSSAFREIFIECFIELGISDPDYAIKEMINFFNSKSQKAGGWKQNTFSIAFEKTVTSGKTTSLSMFYMSY